MPRPTKAMVKNRWLSLRLTAADANTLTARAKARRTTLTGYAREALLTASLPAKSETKYDPEVQAAIREHTRALTRIGTNLNQIAHHLNATGRFVPHDLTVVLNDIRTVMARTSPHDHMHRQR